MKKKTDRRVQRTQQLLEQALLSLIKEKAFDTISVQEIIDRANVGRATFYQHYDNKEDLLESGFKGLEARLRERQREKEIIKGRLSTLVDGSGEVNAALGASSIVPPAVVESRHIFNQYILRTSRRDQLKAVLQAQGVGTEIYYPVPMHLQECFSYLGHGVGSFPESERAAKQTLAIPVHPELSESQARYVVDCIRDFVIADSSPEPVLNQLVKGQADQ